MAIDVSTLMASIRAGEDTGLELKEVSFRGRRMSLGRDERRPLLEEIGEGTKLTISAARQEHRL